MATNALRVQAIGFPGMQRDDSPKRRVVCSCGWESPVYSPWTTGCPYFGMTQEQLAAYGHGECNG